MVKCRSFSVWEFRSYPGYEDEGISLTALCSMSSVMRHADFSSQHIDGSMMRRVIAGVSACKSV